MVVREISLYLVLGHLLIAGVCSVCVPVLCLKCNVPGEIVTNSSSLPSPDSCEFCSNSSTQCINEIPPNCKKDFQVSVNSTGSEAEEGDDITLTCVHNLPDFNLTFEWKKDEEFIKGQNTSKLLLEKVLSHNAGQYTCFVNGPCGNNESSPHGVTINSNSVVILVICGVSALVLVVIMGLAMKFKMKRDNTKHKERMKQRAQVGQSGGPAPFTPRDT